MDVQPISPFFGKENKNPVCDVEEICLPYELEDTLRPKALRKADCNAQRQSVKKGGRPPADLKRGAFSRKQTFGLVMGNISVLSEQDTSLDHSILEYPSANISFIDTIAVKADSRSQSPITTGRNNKIQQLSRRFKLNKVELAKQVHRGQTRSEEPPPGLRAKPGGREETLMPTFSFLRDLQDLLSLS